MNSIKYITNDNKKYFIELSEDNNGIAMKFIEEDDNKALPHIYKGSFKFNELKEKNRFFTIYDSIEDLFVFFNGIIEQKKLIIKKELNELKTIWVFIKGISEDKIQLTLSMVNIDKDEIIDSLINEVQHLKIENNQLNKRISLIEERLNTIEKGKEEETENNEGLINNIITCKIDSDKLKFFLFQKQKIQFKLLYQATRDGDEIDDIIDKIKGYSPTLFLIHTRKGIICGGYTHALWNMDGKYKNDNSAFLYNFTQKKIFSCKNYKEAIICNSDLICFGNKVRSDYYIRNRFLSQKIYEAKKKLSYYGDNYSIQEENEAEIVELEIYHCL